MSVDPQIKFSRVWKGYDPKVVDVAFDEMQYEIEELKQVNRYLLNIVKQYDIKLMQLAKSTKQLEEERASEFQRLSAYQ